MGNLMSMVNGYKSYIVAAAAVGYGVWMGWSGEMPWAEVLDYVLGGAALASVKSALNKVGM